LPNTSNLGNFNSS